MFHSAHQGIQGASLGGPWASDTARTCKGLPVIPCRGPGTPRDLQRITQGIAWGEPGMHGDPQGPHGPQGPPGPLHETLLTFKMVLNTTGGMFTSRVTDHKLGDDALATPNLLTQQPVTQSQIVQQPATRYESHGTRNDPAECAKRFGNKTKLKKQ